MRVFAAFIVKLIIILGLACFALVNYRCLTFDKGWSTVSINNNESVSAFKLINSIPSKIEYYEKTISNNEYGYKVFIVTNGDNYLLDATEQDIQALDVLGIFASNIKPEKIAPIPFYVEIIIGVIVLIIPVRRKKKSD